MNGPTVMRLIVCIQLYCVRGQRRLEALPNLPEMLSHSIALLLNHHEGLQLPLILLHVMEQKNETPRFGRGETEGIFGDGGMVNAGRVGRE